MLWLKLFDNKYMNQIGGNKQEEIDNSINRILIKYKDITLLQYLNDKLNPKELNIENVKYTQLKTKNVEVWTEGPVLVISEDGLKEIKEKI